VIFAATLIALTVLRVGVFKLMLTGAVLGVLRSQVPVIRGVKAAGRLIVTWTIA
jgi:hypothetical protein